MSRTVELTRTLPPPAAAPLAVGSTVRCPDHGCGQPADVLATWVWSSTDGPMPHARTRCLVGHVFTPPVDWLDAV